jgi:hypothetical protein
MIINSKKIVVSWQIFAILADFWHLGRFWYLGGFLVSWQIFARYIARKFFCRYINESLNGTMSWMVDILHER